jgi:hypothetical protein
MVEVLAIGVNLLILYNYSKSADNSEKAQVIKIGSDEGLEYEKHTSYNFRWI